MDGFPQDPRLRFALSLIYKVVLDMLHIVLSVINADHILKYSVIYAQAPSPESGAHKSSVQICREEHFPQVGWRVSKQEGTSKHEREQGRKAKIGRVREKEEGAVAKEGGFPLPFFWVCGTPSWAAGYRDATSRKRALDGSSMPGNTALKESVEQP